MKNIQLYEQLDAIHHHFTYLSDIDTDTEKQKQKHNIISSSIELKHLICYDMYDMNDCQRIIFSTKKEIDNWIDRNDRNEVIKWSEVEVFFGDWFSQWKGKIFLEKMINKKWGNPGHNNTQNEFQYFFDVKRRDDDDDDDDDDDEKLKGGKRKIKVKIVFEKNVIAKGEYVLVRKKKKLCRDYVKKMKNEPKMNEMNERMMEDKIKMMAKKLKGKKDEYNRTIVFYFCNKGVLDGVKLCKELGYDFFLRDIFGRTARNYCNQSQNHICKFIDDNLKYFSQFQGGNNNGYVKKRKDKNNRLSVKSSRKQISYRQREEKRKTVMGISRVSEKKAELLKVKQRLESSSPNSPEEEKAENGLFSPKQYKKEKMKSSQSDELINHKKKTKIKLTEEEKKRKKLKARNRRYIMDDQKSAHVKRCLSEGLLEKKDGRKLYEKKYKSIFRNVYDEDKIDILCKIIFEKTEEKRLTEKLDVFKTRFDELKKNLKKFNIVVIGERNAGKTSLINNVMMNRTEVDFSTSVNKLDWVIRYSENSSISFHWETSTRIEKMVIRLKNRSKMQMKKEVQRLIENINEIPEDKSGIKSYYNYDDDDNVKKLLLMNIKYKASPFKAILSVPFRDMKMGCVIDVCEMKRFEQIVNLSDKKRANVIIVVHDILSNDISLIKNVLAKSNEGNRVMIALNKIDLYNKGSIESFVTKLSNEFPMINKDFIVPISCNPKKMGYSKYETDFKDIVIKLIKDAYFYLPLFELLRGFIETIQNEFNVMAKRFYNFKEENRKDDIILGLLKMNKIYDPIFEGLKKIIKNEGLGLIKELQNVDKKRITSIIDECSRDGICFPKRSTKTLNERVSKFVKSEFLAPFLERIVEKFSLNLTPKLQMIFSQVKNESSSALYQHLITYLTTSCCSSDEKLNEKVGSSFLFDDISSLLSHPIVQNVANVLYMCLEDELKMKKKKGIFYYDCKGKFRFMKKRKLFFEEYFKKLFKKGNKKGHRFIEKLLNEVEKMLQEQKTELLKNLDELKTLKISETEISAYENSILLCETRLFKLLGNYYFEFESTGGRCEGMGNQAIVERGYLKFKHFCFSKSAYMTFASKGIPACRKILLQSNLKIHQKFFLRESHIQSSIKHDNILKVFYFTKDDDSKRLHHITERKDGDLKTLITTGNLSLVNVCNILIQICLAMDHIRQYYIVHRDLKPANILFSKEGKKYKAFIIDFGLAVNLSSDPNYFAGTKEYMDYSVLLKKGEKGIKSNFTNDIFSFGRIAKEMYQQRITYPYLNNDWKTFFNQVNLCNKHHTKENIETVQDEVSKLTKEYKEYSNCFEIKKWFEEIVRSCVLWNVKNRPTFQTLAQRFKDLQKKFIKKK